MVQTVNKEVFLKRAAKFYELWESGDYGLDKVDSMQIILGDYGDNNYCKTLSFQMWMFQCELLDTLAVFTKESIYILASSKKADFFLPVASDTAQGTVPPIHVMHRNKGDKDAENFKKIVTNMEEAGKNLGYIAKDKFEREFYESWTEVVNSKDFEKIDITPALAHLFSVKDDVELQLCHNSGNAAANMWIGARQKFVKIMNDDKKVRHNKFAEDMEQAVATKSIQNALAEKGSIETAYSPIIMSGGQYSFKWSTESDAKSLIHYGCIISSFGVRYDSYCSNVTRTLLIDPSDSVQKAYENILATQTDLISFLKPGAKLSSVYEKTVAALKARDPRLAENLYKKELGFCTGTNFRESMFTISAKCDEKVQAGMVFIIYLGVDGLKNEKAKDDQGKKVAIAISDTVLVKGEGESNEVLTERAKSRLKSVLIKFAEDEPTKDDNKGSQNGDVLGRGKRSVVLNDQTRSKETNEDKRKEHQKELMQQLNENAKARLAQQKGTDDVKKVKKSNVAYKSYEKFPQDEEINKLNIYVDRRHDTVIVPIFGVPVPFHISTVKNCSQSVEGDFTYLRINFAHPGSNIGKETANFAHPLATYVKELTYRASNQKEHGDINAPSFNLTNAFRLIKEIQKRFKTEEAEEREKEGAVKQDKLVLSTGKANPKLKDLLVRPNIIAKRVSGAIEAHVNGFRYTSMRGDRIDVLYNNIKHAFFQPCDNEMIILLHFHLKYPVLWGKKKYQDIQFYTEVGEITTDLGKYHHMQDRDDIQSEQMEREMRRKLNLTFQNFCDKVVKQTNDMFDFDTPFTELGFLGVPYRSSVTLKPTSACLVHLTEWPTFIVTLDEVELVHFERVSFSVKNFDMVFIFKDYTRKTQMVQQIPMTSLDSVKEWLNSCDIKYNEGLQSLNWPKIMKTITDDPDEFFENGGWSFLDTSQSDEEEANDEDESEASYAPTDEENDDEDESDEDESEGEATDDDEEESGSEDSEEESGKDWSDLEEEARVADKRKEVEDRIRDGDRDRDRDRKRHHHGSSSKHGGPPSKKRR